MSAAATKVELLRNRMASVEKSLEGAQGKGGWTAASQFEKMLTDLTLALIEAEGELADEAEQVELEPDPESLIEAIVGAARDLPSYLLDDLVEALQELQEVEPPETWQPPAAG